MTVVLVTRPAGAEDPLVAELESRGYRVSAVPTVATRAMHVHWPDLRQFDWIVVTSAAGVEALPEVPAGPRWAAVGESTARALRAKRAEADFVPIVASGATLAEELPDPAGLRVLLVRASRADADLPAILRQRGATVEEITAYETIEGPDESAPDLHAALAQQGGAAAPFGPRSPGPGVVVLRRRSPLPAD